MSIIAEKGADQSRPPAGEVPVFASRRLVEAAETCLYPVTSRFAGMATCESMSPRLSAVSGDVVTYISRKCTSSEVPEPTPEEPRRTLTPRG
jgi:hypothetical protein